MVKRFHKGSLVSIMTAVTLVTIGCSGSKKALSQPNVGPLPTPDLGNNRIVLQGDGVVKYSTTPKSTTEKWMDELYIPSDNTTPVRIISQATRKNTITGSYPTV